MNDLPNSGVDPTVPERGYSGVRITAPRRTTGTPGAEAADLAGIIAANPHLYREKLARILTGAALFGVVAIVLLHELGHWLAGLIITGRVPDFYLVAVRQKIEVFSTAGGIITWGAGPVAQAAVLWAILLLASARGERSPRLLVLTGGALLFTVVTHLAVWAGAAFTSPDSWGNDLPRVATFLGSDSDSAQRFWMHMLNAAYAAAIVTAARRWWKLVRVTDRISLYTSTTVIGAVEGGILVLIVTLFVAFNN